MNRFDVVALLWLALAAHGAWTGNASANGTCMILFGLALIAAEIVRLRDAMMKRSMRATRLTIGPATLLRVEKSEPEE